MSWEVHVTLPPAASVACLAAMAARLDGRVHVIELLGGGASAAHQPMVTFAAAEDLSDAGEGFARLRAHVDATTAAIGAAPATRIKIEAAPTTTCVVRYFESHVLVCAPRDRLDVVVAAVQPIATRHGARWSRSTRASADGTAARYLTRRDHGDAASARTRHQAWVAALTDALASLDAVRIEKQHEEAVIWDSNEGLDEGWR